MTEPTTQTDVDAELEGLEVDAPLVGILMGSKSDMAIMEKAAKELTDRGIRNESSGSSGSRSGSFARRKSQRKDGVSNAACCSASWA